MIFRQAPELFSSPRADRADRATGVALLAGVFVGLVAVYLVLTRAGARAGALWLPNALVAAVLLRRSGREDAAVLVACGIASLAANLAIGDVAARAGLFALANMVEVIVMVAVVRRGAGATPPLDRGRTIGWLLAASLAAPMPGATLGVLTPTGVAFDAGPWLAWVLADASGLLIVASLAMVAIDSWRERRRPTRREAIEWLVGIIGAAGVAALVFWQSRFPFLFLACPVVTIAALRKGVAGAGVAVAILTVIASAFTLAGMGPLMLVRGDRDDQVLALQLFFVVIAVMGLFVAAAVSAQVRNDAALAAARERADAAVAAQAAFLAQMSHEIRTPMNGVLGFTDVVLAGPLDEEQRRQVQLIARSGRAMMRLLNDLLDISRTASGKPALAGAPPDRADAQCEERYAAPAAAGGRMVRLLVAEDHDVNQALVIAMCRRIGIEPEIASDGSAAIARIETAAAAGAPFDMVLMDVRMPVLVGLAATRRLRAAGHAMPIVALTANTDPEDVARCLAAGMQGHLAKPLSGAMLAGAIARWAPPRPDASTLSGPAADGSMTGIEARYRARKAEALAALAALAEGGCHDSAARAQVGGLLHKLAGLAGFFNEAALGTAAAALERQLAAARDEDVPAIVAAGRATLERQSASLSGG